MSNIFTQPSRTVNSINGNGTRRASLSARTPPYDENLKQLIASVQCYLFMPDPAPLLLMLATVVSNLMTDGPPVWLMYVGPPSSGKSDLLYLVSSIDSIIEVATLTEAALLSGSDKTGKKGSGGLLIRIGERGIIICKDFTSIISMSWESRNKTLAAFREIYDGKWDRHLGLANGQSLHWHGKLGFLGGVTEQIDSNANQPVISSLGDRFTYCRYNRIDGDKVCNMVLSRDESNNSHVRDALRQAAKEFVEMICCRSWNEQPMSEMEKDWLKAATNVSSIGRAAVIRHPTKRDIEEVMEPESPARLLVSASQLHWGLQRIGCSYQESMRVVATTAVDCIPRKRARLIRLLEINSGLSAEDMRQDRIVDYPRTAIYRTLEEMECLRIVERTGKGVKGDEAKWRINDSFHCDWNTLHHK